MANLGIILWGVTIWNMYIHGRPIMTRKYNERHSLKAWSQRTHDAFVPRHDRKCEQIGGRRKTVLNRFEHRGIDLPPWVKVGHAPLLFDHFLWCLITKTVGHLSKYIKSETIDNLEGDTPLWSSQILSVATARPRRRDIDVSVSSWVPSDILVTIWHFNWYLLQVFVFIYDFRINCHRNWSINTLQYCYCL